MPGVIATGEKLAVTPAGRPEQARLTCALNPPVGLMLIVVEVLALDKTVTDAGLSVMEKFAGVRLMT